MISPAAENEVEAFRTVGRFEVVGETPDNAGGGGASQGGVPNPVPDSVLANFCSDVQGFEGAGAGL